jgi:probable FeS assembly SUF system protein SufT
MSESSIPLKRDITVVRIPSGENLSVPAGTPVIVTQALGGTYTVVIPTEPGLFRIAGEDADALGHDKTVAVPVSSGPVTEQNVWDSLKMCFDPEIPVNIVDLGLIYGLKLTPADGGTAVEVKMTLTAAGCGMGPVIADDARRKILAISGVTDANVELTWDPPWSPDRISAEGKAKLGMV